MQPSTWENLVERVNGESERMWDENFAGQEIVVAEDGKLQRNDSEPQAWFLSDWATTQFCNRLSIPPAYYKTLPGWLKSENANHRLKERGSELEWLVRGKGESIRAMLSGKYVIYNNSQIVEIVSGLLSEGDGVKVHSLSYNDNYMFVKVVSDDLVGEDGLKAGILVGNSEVGAASISVEPFVFRKSCTNDLVVTDTRSQKLPHIYFTPQELTRRIAEGISNSFVCAKETMGKFIQAKDEPIVDPLETIKQLCKRERIPEKLQKTVEVSYLSEPEKNKYGVINAFTNAAQTLQDEKRIGMERFAGQLLTASLN